MSHIPSIDINRKVIGGYKCGQLSHEILSGVASGKYPVRFTPSGNIPYIRLASHVSTIPILRNLVSGHAWDGIIPHTVDAVIQERRGTYRTHTDLSGYGLVKSLNISGDAEVRIGEGYGAALTVLNPGDMLTVHNENIPQKERIPHAVNPLRTPRIGLILGWVDIPH